jgi:hypothetical protein
MIRYEVVLNAESAHAGAVAEYMRDIHIPAIFETGCFESIRLERGMPGRFCASYCARRAEDLERYLRDHAPLLRDAFLARFPRGVTVARETWTEVGVWE